MESFKANAIFLQPTWTCQKNCQGCYVKEKESKYGSDEIDANVWLKLIHHIGYDSRLLKPKQVTLALDTLPKTAARYKMSMIAAWYFDTVKHFDYADMDDSPVQWHLTVNTIHDLQQYDPEEGNNGLALCSVSHLNNIDDIHIIKDFFPRAKINWNVMSGEFSKMVESDINKVKSMIQKVDSVYLLLHKAPMGLEGHDFNSFFKALESLKKLKAKPVETDGQACAVPDVTSKIITDGCMVDAAKFKKTGHGCSSNISRFQVWPDGRVTGCAYNSHNQYGKFANSFDDILDNLRDAKDRYEFESCSIPKGLSEHSDKKHLQVTT